MTDPITLAAVTLWAVEHLHLPAIGFAIWRASRFFSHIENRAVKLEENVNTLSTNHFPHMEASLTRQDGMMHEMTQSLKTIASQTKRIKAARKSPTRRKK